MRKLNFFYSYSLLVVIAGYVSVVVLLACAHQPPLQQAGFALQSSQPTTDKKNLNNDKWTRTEVPFGKSGEIIVFNGKGSAAIIGYGSVLLSHDDGRTWQETAGGGGSDLYTTDGGATYSSSYKMVSYSGEKQPFSISANDICSVENAGFTSSGRLYVHSVCDHHSQLWSIPTKNVSDSWHVRRFGQVSESDDEYYTPYNELVVLGDRVLVDAVLPQGTSILATDDSGKTWTKLWHNKNVAARVVGLDFLNEQEGWMLLGDGKIFRTDTGGRSWQIFSELPPYAAGKIVSLDFVSSKTGFAAGEDGLILTTENGGQTWQRQNSPTNKFLYKIAAADEKKAWATGENATVLETNDGGINWRKVELNIKKDNLATTNIYNLTVKDKKAWIILGKFIYISP